MLCNPPTLNVLNTAESYAVRGWVADAACAGFLSPQRAGAGGLRRFQDPRACLCRKPYLR